MSRSTTKASTKRSTKGSTKRPTKGPTKRPTTRPTKVTPPTVWIALVAIALILGYLYLGGSAALSDLVDSLPDPDAQTSAPAGEESTDAQSGDEDRWLFPESGSEAVEDPSTAEREALDHVNAARAEAGRAPLAPHAALMAAARAHSADLADSGECRHEGSDGSSVSDRIERQGYSATAYAENVACGARTAAKAVSSWQGSKAHRTNMLNAAYVHAGIGVASSGPDAAPMWTLVLARGDD